MKALSIQQPWPWLIVRPDILDREQWEKLRLDGLVKDVENRDWHTTFRGPFFLHAGKKFDYDGYEAVLDRIEGAFAMPKPGEYQMGGIVGAAHLTDCVPRYDSPLWFVGKFGFVIRNAIPTTFFPCRGQLGFFDVAEFRDKRPALSELPNAAGKPAEGAE